MTPREIRLSAANSELLWKRFVEAQTRSAFVNRPIDDPTVRRAYDAWNRQANGAGNSSTAIVLPFRRRVGRA